MRHAILFVTCLAACGPDETLSGYANPDVTYRLTEIDGAAYTATATIRTDESGMIRGTGPCNRFSATQTVPYPWFEAGPILSTRRACPDLPAETDYFAALSDMTLAEALGDVLILSNDAGREMVFQAE